MRRKERRRVDTTVLYKSCCLGDDSNRGSEVGATSAIIASRYKSQRPVSLVVNSIVEVVGRIQNRRCAIEWAAAVLSITYTFLSGS